MAQEKIDVIYDVATKQMVVGAPMDNQEQKDRTIRMLLSAIKIVLDYQPAVIKPAAALPGIVPFGNGMLDAKRQSN